MHSAASEGEEEEGEEEESSPWMRREERFFGEGTRKGCVEKVMRRAEW